MFSQGVIPSKEASNSPGLCPIGGQKSGLCSWTRGSNQFSSLSLGTDKNPPHYHMMVTYPAFCLSHILPRNPEVRFRSNRLVNSIVSCELVGNFISSSPRMTRGPKHPHSMLGGNVIQRHLALLYQWRRFSSLKGFQNRLTVRASTYFSDLAFV
jgi:hypothetical protein